ncbi:helix-turn-helix transcriptional regulator [Streptomyces sp. NBC_01217]|uniref:helix-turn-helix transcriptional regulator n=1 Tax=Streptomyces sp. NBC_01217 TaxID=2903779 RepID=UPI002E0FF326|nr:LuxR C-terminal-related transcriptional regulator [Streptomyces sp. NBC_01217]
MKASPTASVTVARRPGGAVSAGRGHRALGEAVAILAGSPRPLVLAAAVEDHGRALLTADHRQDAIAALDNAHDLYTASGAHGEAARVRQLLQSVGVRRRGAAAPARPRTGWASLTRTERRVAELVAAGHTNRSAAAELVLSPNTVATHLRSIFAKLGVNSCVQLTRTVLDENP